MSPEPLDYQMPRSRDNSQKSCPRCGGTRLVEGKLMGGTSVRFLPTRPKKFWTLKNGAKTQTHACMSCGYITTVIDPDDLRRLIGPGDPGSAAT